VIDPITLTAASIQQDMQRMNVIANNSANALTSGFKREYLTLASSATGASQVPGEDAISTLVSKVITDNRPGVPRQTGNPLDIALLGEGYFEIRTDNGIAYTRQGTFRLNDQNYLVNQDGFPVSGVNGDIVLSSSTPTIDREGRIFEQGKQVAQIKVASFAPADLRSIGGGLMISMRDSQNEVPHPAMAQNQLESSNVDSTQEMVRLMETFRHFETSHRILQAYDDIQDKALRNLGQF
jgi:flagellar basal-body rod protein FlgG